MVAVVQTDRRLGDKVSRLPVFQQLDDGPAGTRQAIQVQCYVRGRLGERGLDLECQARRRQFVGQQHGPQTALGQPLGSQSLFEARAHSWDEQGADT